MSEFLEILSPSAKADLEAIMPLVDKLAKDIKEINNFKASGTPSGADNAIKKQTESLKEQGNSLDQVKKKLEMISSLNKQRYQEEAKLIADNDKALTYKSEKELKQIRDKQAMIASLNKQKEQERKETEKTVLANEKLNRAYVQLNKQRELAKNKLQDLIASERASNAEIRKAQKEFDVLNKKVAAADKAVGRFSDANRKINGLASSVGNLMTAFGISTGIYLAVDLAKNIYETAKKLQGLDLALKMVSGTTKEFAENQAFIAATSEKWGLEIKSATEQYTKFYTASKGILSDTEIKDIFASLAKSGSLLGASAEKQESTFIALEQIMSKGKVTAEELTKQLGNAMPGALRAMAMAYQELHPQITDIQKAEQALFTEMRKGALDASIYVPLYVKNYEKLVGIEMVNKVETLQASQNRLKNSWTELVRSFNEADNSGFTRFIKGIMDSLKTFSEFTSLLFKDENQTSAYFKNLGKIQGASYYNDVMANIKNTSEENIKATKKELIERENLNIELNKKIIAEEKKKRESIAGGDRALFHLKTKLEEDAIVQIGKSAEIIKKIRQSELDAKTTGGTGGGAKETEAQRKKREDAERKSEEKRLKSIEEANKLEYDLKMSNLEREKELIKDLRDNKETSLEDMLFLEQAFAYKEIQIAQAVYDEEVRLAGESGAKQQIALNKFLTAKENAIKDSQDRQAKSQEDFTKEQLQKTKDWYAKNPPIGIFETGTSKEDRENDLAKKRQQFKDTVKLFNEFAGDFASKSGFSQTFENFFKENKEGVSLFDTLFDDESILSKQEKQLAAFQVISSAAQDTMNLISDFEEERFQRSIYRLEREKEIALQFAGDSAAAKEKIEAQFEKKRIDLEKKEFKRKQKMAIANIAIDTAQAIIGLWVKPGFPAAIPMSIAMGALGIAQAGMVASQKPPEYWKGTDNAEAGLAWTQERGAEIVLDKHNRIKSFGSDGGAQLTMLDKGDKVKTADQTKKLMFDNGLNSILSDNGIKEAKIEIVNSGITVDEMDMVIGKHFANIQTNHTSFDNRGIQQWSEKNGNRTIRNANRGSGIGFRV